MKILTTALCAAFLLTVGGEAAQAQNQPPANAPEVVIADRVVMRIRTGAGAMTAQERAEEVRLRLGPILTMPNLSAADIEVRQRRRGQDAQIYVRDRLLITVDRNLAQANRNTPQGLANIWARNLRETLPLIRVEVR